MCVCVCLEGVGVHVYASSQMSLLYINTFISWYIIIIIIIIIILKVDARKLIMVRGQGALASIISKANRQATTRGKYDS